MAKEIARLYWRFVVLSLLAGTALGILCAISLLSPDYLSAHPAFTYGRLVAAHRASMIYGVLFFSVIASAYSLLPKLMRAELIFGIISKIVAWMGMAIVLAGIVMILAGFGSGREYSDFPILIAIVFWFFLITVAFDMGLMISRSGILVPGAEAGLLFLAVILPAVVFPFTIPDWWGGRFFDALRTWSAWRTIFTGSFVITAIGLAIWYLGHFRLKIRLSSGAFALAIVMVVVFSPMMGTVHLLDAPVFPGLKSLGAFAGVLVATGLVMIVRMVWKTGCSGASDLLLTAGLAGIVASALQGVIMVIPPVYSLFHFTSNTSAHAHIALGAPILIFLSAAIVLSQELARNELYGAKFAASGAGWFMSGLVMVVLSQMSAGVLQASAFAKGLSSPDWLPMFRWLQLGTILGGIAALAGVSIIARIILRTLASPAPTPSIINPEIPPVRDVPKGAGG